MQVFSHLEKKKKKEVGERDRENNKTSLGEKRVVLHGGEEGETGIHFFSSLSLSKEEEGER